MSQIGGNLPFGLLGAAASTGNAIAGAYPGVPGVAGLGSAYSSAYNAALDMNEANYNNVLGGYQTLANQQAGAQQQVLKGYGSLQGMLANTLGFGGTPWGVAAPAAQAIEDLYTQQNSSQMASAQNRNLSNTTVLPQLQQAPALNATRSLAGLGANLAQTYAGYESNLDLAALGYQGQAANANTALGENQLSWMNSVNSPPPNASAYGQLAQQAGQYAMLQKLQGRIGGAGGALGGYGTAGVARSGQAPMTGGNMTMGGAGYTSPYGLQSSFMPAPAPTPQLGYGGQPIISQPTNGNMQYIGQQDASGAYNLSAGGVLGGIGGGLYAGLGSAFNGQAPSNYNLGGVYDTGMELAGSGYGGGGSF